MQATFSLDSQHMSTCHGPSHKQWHITIQNHEGSRDSWLQTNSFGPTNIWRCPHMERPLRCLDPSGRKGIDPLLKSGSKQSAMVFGAQSLISTEIENKLFRIVQLLTHQEKDLLSIPLWRGQRPTVTFQAPGQKLHKSLKLHPCRQCR